MLKDPIGIFDSGVGGLSIWRAIGHLLPRQNAIYVADQKYLPYGEKSDEEITARATKITRFLINQGCSLIVVACNSATVSALPQLRRQYKVPFVGVEPAVKPAAKKSQTGEICVLATKKTAASQRHRSLIENHALGVTVKILVASEFIELVEAANTDSPLTSRVINNFFSKHELGKSDVLVLGCTHYIFLKNTIKSLVNPGLTILEPSRSVAQRVKWISKKQGRTKQNSPGRHVFYSTKDAQRFSSVAEKLLGRPLTCVSKINI